MSRDSFLRHLTYSTPAPMNEEQILGDFVKFAVVLMFKLDPDSCIVQGKHCILVTLQWEE